MNIIELCVIVFIGSVAGILGGVVLLFKEEWAGLLSKYSIPLAAGVLLTVSFLDILPHAVEDIDHSAYYVIVMVFVFSFLIEKFIFPLHHHENTHKHHKTHIKTAVPMVIAGDTIHNFLDGVAIAAAYHTEPRLGWIVAISTFLHETPHEIADFGILLRAGWSRKKALIINFLSALATYPGALVVVYLIGFSQTYIGFLMAIAAGLFLYVSTTDFLPHFGDDDDGLTIGEVASFLIGVLLIVLVTQLIPEH